DDAGNLLPALEQDERRDRHHAIRPCGLRVLVDVELRHLQGLALLVPDLLHDRGNHVTRDAPLRPEVHEDRGIGVENRRLEIRFRDRSDVRHDGSFSFVRAPARAAGTDPYALERYLAGRTFRQWPWASSSRKRSASIAALHPCPAAVTACR